ncbi:hypothetical protein [Halovivax asiaticus]|nr:hypothetical protein [Halovivax asiaticus]
MVIRREADQVHTVARQRDDRSMDEQSGGSTSTDEILSTDCG